MDSANASSEVAHDFSPLIKVHKDGKVERLRGTDIVPPSLDPKTNVDSKDVVYSPENNLSARLYLPKNTNQNQKLPLLVYFHGGGFCIETAFSPTYHNYLNDLVSEANIIAVSVDYRRAPEHPLPIAYEDSWDAVKWLASHVDGNVPKDWLNRNADFERVFYSGNSAGANIAHHMAIRNEPAAEIAIDLSPTIKVYKDGKVERLKGNDIVPASFDPKTKVHSKDVVYSPENDLYARLYIPNQRQNQNQNQKLPLLVYFHGGGFCIETAFSPTYHNYLNTLVSEANVIAVSSLNESRMQCCGYAQSRYVMLMHKICNNLVVDQKDNLLATYSRDVEPSQISVGEK
ncbi:hypothetical protein CUMW_199820 [Citrus unshiu]|nr:hypothetical protein CUMW_199820 [Citrus unshiu]